MQKWAKIAFGVVTVGVTITTICVVGGMIQKKALIKKILKTYGRENDVDFKKFLETLPVKELKWTLEQDPEKMKNIPG